MRRNSLTQETISYFFIYLLFVLYCFLADIYVFFPPLLGIFFVLFSQALAKHNLARLAFLITMLFWFECDRGLPFGSLLVIYLLLYAGIYRPIVFLFRKNIPLFSLIACYCILFLLFGLYGSYSVTQSWWVVFGIFAYYTFIEGVIIGTLKI